MVVNRQGLPVLNIDMGLGQYDKELTEKESTSRALQQFKLDQENKTGVAKRTGSPIITFELLEIAPDDFFDQFKSQVKVVTSKIISEISQSRDNAINISKHKKDPTNPALKENIIYIVTSEFNKVERDDNSIMTLDRDHKDILLAMVIDEIIGLGPLEPLWRERKITEIMCNGPHDIQVEINGIVRKMPSVRFRDENHLKALIDKLYSSINKQLSPTVPYQRGRLHDNSRLYAVHEVIAPNGPNFNIRKHSDDYWTVQDIINRGTADEEIMTDIGNMINAGASFLVVGGTGTGKTTLLNALTGFIPDNNRIITLEENLEMKPHPGKLIAAPMECVPARIGDGREFGVNMRDLVRSSLQMRPDTILIGEVSDGAAYDLCQALNTGHSGGSTVHANDSRDAIGRLSSLVSQEEFVRGPAVLDLIGSAFDIMIVVDRLSDGSRRIVEVVEFGRIPIKGENDQLTLETFPLWEFEATDYTDEFGDEKIHSSWKKVGNLSEYRQKKHRLQLRRDMSWEELLEISTYNVPKQVYEDEGGK